MHTALTRQMAMVLLCAPAILPARRACGAPQFAPRWVGPFQPEPTRTLSVEPSAKDLGALVRDLNSPAVDRLDAASRLLARATQADARSEVFEILSDPLVESGVKPRSERRSSRCAAGVMLDAIARMPVAPRALQENVLRLLAGADQDQMPGLLAAISSFRSRQAARELFAATSELHPPAVRAAGFSGLARLTGRSDLSAERAEWSVWMAGAEAMSEEEWQATLLASLAARSDGQARMERELSVRLIESLRRLHLATPAEGRPLLVAGMLADGNDEVRALGFELASRELSESRALGPAVAETAVGLLHHPAPEVRSRAARLVSQLNPPKAAGAVLEALTEETDPRAASALIQASLRWPSRDWLEAVLRWTRSNSVAVGPATDSVWAMVRAGLVSASDDRARILESLRALTPAQLSASACQALAAIGSDADRDTLASLLVSEPSATRVGAAEALLGYREHLGEILEAAAKEPQIFETAVRGTVMFRPDRAGYDAVAALPADSVEVRRRARLAVAAVLPADDLLAVVDSSVTDPAFNESLLELFARPERVLSERVNPARAAAIAEGLVRLAQARIDLGRPDAALTALDALSQLPGLVDPKRLAVVRATALLCLNRPSDEFVAAAPVSVWLDAIERVADKPFSASLANIAEARFKSTMSVEEAIRLAKLRAKLPVPQESPTVPDGTDSVSEFVGPLLPSDQAGNK